MAVPINYRLHGVIIAVWAAVVVTGVFWLYHYANEPSVNAAAPENWPDVPGLRRYEEAPSLLVFLHPHCPCSQATVSELEKLTAQTGGTLPTCVVFLHPDGVPSDWHRTSLWKRVLAIPGVTVFDDAGCSATRQFGVATSGQALLYDAEGHLRFSGGITAARGHAGSNAGCDIILSLIRDDFPRLASSAEMCSVFGCPLFQSSEAAVESRKEAK